MSAVRDSGVLHGDVEEMQLPVWKVPQVSGRYCV